MEVIEAAAWRQKEHLRATVTGAWYAAVFYVQAKHGKLDDLENILPGDGGPPEDLKELPPEQEELLWAAMLIPASTS